MTSNNEWGDLMADRRVRDSESTEDNPWSNKPGWEGYCRACEEKKRNCHEHHISYTPESTITVCASCHYRIHHESGYYDEWEPDFMRRRRERLEKRVDEPEFDIMSPENKNKINYFLVQLPDEYLNGRSPKVIEEFEEREDAKSAKLGWARDLPGYLFEIMVPGESLEVEVKIMGCERDMNLIICRDCKSLHLTDAMETHLCLKCRQRRGEEE